MGWGWRREPEVAVRSINTASFEWVVSIMKFNSFTIWGKFYTKDKPFILKCDSLSTCIFIILPLPHSIVFSIIHT